MSNTLTEIGRSFSFIYLFICNSNRTEWRPNTRKLFNVALKLRSVDLNYNFKCDWLIELSDNKLSNNKLSDNKLSDNNLGSELGEKRRFLNQS